MKVEQAGNREDEDDTERTRKIYRGPLLLGSENSCALLVGR